MKNHKQLCGLAVSLDFVGDRWTLLIVRELLISPRGFSQLQECLAGCSPNLLVSRLKEMSRNGLLEQKMDSLSRRELYHLTEIGRSLRDTVECLIRWGGSLLPGQKQLIEKRPHWLEVAIPALLRPKLKNGFHFKIQFVVNEYSFIVAAYDLELNILNDLASRVDCTLILTYQRLLALMSGRLSPKALSVDEIRSTRFAKKSAAAAWLQRVLE